MSWVSKYNVWKEGSRVCPCPGTCFLWNKKGAREGEVHSILQPWSPPQVRSLKNTYMGRRVGGWGWAAACWGHAPSPAHPQARFLLFLHQSCLGWRKTVCNLCYPTWQPADVGVYWVLRMWLVQGKDRAWNFTYYFFFDSFMWLSWVLVVTCGIQFPYQGANLGPLHWECGVLATGPPGKSLNFT